MVRELRVTPIRNGTVIDHIPPGMGLRVLEIILAERDINRTISLAMNVPSRRNKKKDIVKVEDVELTPFELGKIALIAPDATINIIRDYEVVEKRKVELPDTVLGILRCPNPNCITNQREPVTPEFRVLSRKPIRLRCVYCEREVANVIESLV